MLFKNAMCDGIFDAAKKNTPGQKGVFKNHLLPSNIDPVDSRKRMPSTKLLLERCCLEICRP